MSSNTVKYGIARHTFAETEHILPSGDRLDFTLNFQMAHTLR